MLVVSALCVPCSSASLQHKERPTGLLEKFDQHLVKSRPDHRSPSPNMVYSQFDYVFGIGTCFALLDAYNNGASKLYGLRF